VKNILIGVAFILIFSGATAVAQNNPPVFDTTYTTGTVAEGGVLSWDISAADPDSTDTVTYFIDPPIEPPFDESIYKGDAQFQPVGNIMNFLFTPFYDWTDLDPVVLQTTFGATDGIDTILMPVTITITQFNPPPEFQPVQNYRTAEGVPLQFTVQASDPDGAVPAISTDSIPNNATFTDNGDGTGSFDFTPDATQYGDTAQDYVIPFIASDGEKADTAIVVIRVVGPYLKAILNAVSSKSVAEGDTLKFNISGSDPNDVMLELGVLGDSPTHLDVGETINDTAHVTYYANYVKADTTHTDTLYAYNGRDTTFNTVQITVRDSMNYPPVFAPLPHDTIDEGSGSINDTISATDPEGNTVSLTLLADDTVGLTSVSFDDNHDGTGVFTFTPNLTEGGDYEFRIQASDYLAGESDIAMSVGTLFVKVNEVDSPPVLTVVASDSVKAIKEGGYIGFDLMATDIQQDSLPIIITPPPNSSVYKGNVVYARTSDTTATFEFYPDFNQVTSGTDTTYKITFATEDSIEEVSQQVFVTVLNVPKGNNDPWEADTLTLVGTVWDSLIIPRDPPDDTLMDTVLGFEINGRIWNDSNITAGMTGFSWDEPWLKCDTVEFGAPFVSGPNPADYRQVDIANNVRAFQPIFFFMQGNSLPPIQDGNWDYFTARFVIDTTMVDMDTVHIESLPKIRFRPQPYGTNAAFVFSKLPYTNKSPEAIRQYLSMMVADSTSYPPLTIVGDVRSASDSVKISIFDVDKGITMGDGDVLYMFDQQDSVKHYELRVSVENRDRLAGLSLGYRMYSDNGAIWAYGDIVPVVNPFSRMAPDTAVWQGSGGLTMTGSSMNGSGADSLVFRGTAGAVPDDGLPRGLMQYMVAVPFTVGGVADYETDTIWFDTITTNGSDYVWNFTREGGDSLSPGFDTNAICFPVKSRLLTDVNDQSHELPLVYSLEQNYPNPFNATTTIRFRIPRQEHVTITVYNVLGQKVSILADGAFPPGEHNVVWNGCDRRGKPAATGIYLYQIKSEGLTKTKKMILLK
jgi:hypothetical protein